MLQVVFSFGNAERPMRGDTGVEPGVRAVSVQPFQGLDSTLTPEMASVAAQNKNGERRCSRDDKRTRTEGDH